MAAQIKKEIVQWENGKVETVACLQQLRRDVKDVAFALESIRDRSTRTEREMKTQIDYLLQQLDFVREEVRNQRVQFGQDDLSQLKTELDGVTHSLSSVQRVMSTLATK